MALRKSSPQPNRQVAPQRSLLILGTRGIPASHGGFETFAEQLSLYLAAAGWKVTVYCQEEGVTGPFVLEEWRGVLRAVVPVKQTGSAGSLIFDWKSLRHALGQDGLILILGYNTGIFTLLPRLLGRAVVLNMDGIEWKRAKWSRPIKAWFWLNERVAAWAGTTLIADHPEIKAHLATRVSQEKITVLPYAADTVVQADETHLQSFALTSRNYLLTVCRLEPENSVLEIVRAFCRRKRNCKLVVLGKLDPANVYHAELQAAAGSDVIFPGPIYEKDVLAALRFHARAYCHGHTVGGTNPSLVEALGAGNAVFAHDNAFNRWTAGEEQFFFESERSCEQLFSLLLEDDRLLERARKAARLRHAAEFLVPSVMSRYEAMLTSHLPRPQTTAQSKDQALAPT